MSGTGPTMPSRTPCCGTCRCWVQTTRHWAPEINGLCQATPAAPAKKASTDWCRRYEAQEPGRG